MDVQTPPPTVANRALIDALHQQLQAQTDQPVALVETHISWVLLTEHLVYKIKKPVQLPFADFSTLVSRLRCTSVSCPCAPPSRRRN